MRIVAGALAAGCLALVAAALVVALRPDPPPRPAVTATITGCDVSSAGSAQVTFTVTNGDRAPHGYRVDLTVLNGQNPVGAGTSLITNVDPGTTATAQALVPLKSTAAGTRCLVRANAHDGHTGHSRN